MPHAVRTLQQRLNAPSRLAALNRTGLLDSPEEDLFDRITHIASLSLRVPVALLSLVTAERQFFKSHIGLPTPHSESRETPLSHSFCKHVVAANAPLMVEDASIHPLVCDNPAVADLGVLAYLGVPVHTPDQETIGALCAIHSTRHAWSEQDRLVLEHLSALITEELWHREQAQRTAELEAELAREQSRLQDTLTHVFPSLPSAPDAVDTMQEKHRSLDSDAVEPALCSMRQYYENKAEQDYRAKTRELEHLKTTILHNLSHEIRTPITAIIGFTDLLSETISDPDQCEMLQFILDGSIRLQSTLEGLLTYGQLTSNGWTIQHRPYKPADLAYQTLAPFAAQARAKNLPFTVEDHTQKAVYEGPSQGIARILHVLTHNAIKFTAAGHVQVRISDANHCLRVDVKDTGPGIAPAQVDQIFDPFWQGSSGLDRAYEGTGLGLSIASQIAKSIGGTLSVESTLGKGSTFTFTMPLGQPVRLTAAA